MCDIDLATFVIKVNIAFIWPYQVPPFLSIKIPEFIGPCNPLPLLECREKWDLPHNLLMVSCICSHITNSVFTDIHHGIMCNLLKWFLALFDTIPHYQPSPTIWKLQWTPRAWEVFGCTCVFVFRPELRCGWWFDAIFSCRFTKLSSGFHGTDESIFVGVSCWTQVVLLTAIGRVKSVDLVGNYRYIWTTTKCNTLHHMLFSYFCQTQVR